MTNAPYTIRPMVRAELDLAVQWAAGEGWNPGRHDADAFFATDRRGFLIGLLGDEPVATASAVAYGAGFGFFGFYIVRPDCRGRGYGLQIAQASLQRLAGRTVGLDGVVAQTDNYRRSGFSMAHNNARYELAGSAAPRPMPRGDGGRIVPAAELPFADLEAYDRAFFAASRSAFLRAWIAMPDSAALALLRDGRIVGYGVRRACRVGHKIGPLFADSRAGAEALLDALCRDLPSCDPVYLDLPECRAEAVDLARSRGMRKVFETVRMYTSPAPDISLDRTWGITSFELG